MYKIFLTVRNRLALTCKCITGLKKHSVLSHQLYIYDNLTSTKIQEHFMYWSILYEKGLIDQLTFTTKESTFNSFSKAVTCNMFGKQHLMDPDKNKYDFLVFLDNDILVSPGWDEIIKQAWHDIKRYGLDNIKVIGQFPGGIKYRTDVPYKIAGRKAFMGKLGGSAFWCVRPDFFENVGFLDLSFLVGQNKKHDQHYWTLLERSSGGKPYILGLDERLAIHVGGRISPSMCNILTKSNGDTTKIDNDESDKTIDDMSFDSFYNMIINDKDLLNNW
jgi:hypothetical protein